MTHRVMVHIRDSVSYVEMIPKSEECQARSAYKRRCSNRLNDRQCYPRSQSPRTHVSSDPSRLPKLAYPAAHAARQRGSHAG
jgi:hypothetical protein